MATKRKTTKKAGRKSSKAKSTIGKCGAWKAWLNVMPLGTPTLHVTGKCVGIIRQSIGAHLAARTEIPEANAAVHGS